LLPSQSIRKKITKFSRITSRLFSGFKVEPLQGQGEGGQQKVVMDVKGIFDVVVH
jgi:hypothetical protein